MKGIEDYYDIRRAKYEEIDDIMSYLDSYWKKGHILAVNRDIFEYEFVDDEKKVNMYICREKSSGNVCALEGYIYTAYDKNLRDAWGAIWHSRADNKILLLGTYLRRKMMNEIGIRHFVGVGNNPNTSLRIAQSEFGEYTCKMDHFYRLNQIGDYRIAVINHKNSKHGNKAPENRYEFKRIQTAEELSVFDWNRFTGQVPFLDQWYITRRYVNHPVYHYEIYGAVSENGNMDALFIFRRVEVGDRAALRLIRFVGDQRVLSGSYDYIGDLLADQSIEYIDFYCAGFDRKNIYDAGFDLLEEHDTNIIPNYFEPFVQENIDIYCDSTAENTIFCKGDADQDRPNFIPGNQNRSIRRIHVMDEILKVLKKVRDDVDFIGEKHLIDDGILDSVDTLSIVGELEELFHIEFSPMDLTADNFNNVKAIEKLVERIKNEPSH